MKFLNLVGNFFHYIWSNICYFFYRYQIWRWFILISLSITFAVSALLTYKAKTVNIKGLMNSLSTFTTIYDNKNQKVGELYANKGTYVNFNEISPAVKNAVISTEDRTFYTNPGFSIKGILRALVSYITHHGEILSGGSTITQQLAKNSLLSQRQTFSRKLKGLFYAIQITKTYSKQDILTMYLNDAYFGNGVWGVQDAAKRYFDKNASQLNVPEGATLAAMLKSPSFYNPVEHPNNAIYRRNLVIKLMNENGKVTDAEAKQFQNAPLIINDGYVPKENYKYPSYFNGVINEAISDGISEESVMDKGYKIYTYLNPIYQQQMQNVYSNSNLFPAAAPDGAIPQSSSIALNPKNGGVMATVGSRGPISFRNYSYATMAKMQVGSTMKPLAVYTPAIQEGYHLDSMIEDKKISYGPTHYTPTNWNNQYLGKVPLYVALYQSLNTPAVWLLNDIGINKGVESVERFGINVPRNKEQLGLALGDINVSPYEMARAYCVFANGGYLPQTHFIKKIVTASGKVIVDNTKLQNKRVISSKVANEMTSMMIDVYKYGTGKSGKPNGYTIAGKTGGTQIPTSWGDPNGTGNQWMIGYTPDIVVTTWIGFANTNQQQYLHSSISAVANIFKNEMEGILPYTAQTSFKVNDAQSIVQGANNNINSSNNENNNIDSIWNNVKNKINNGINNIIRGDNKLGNFQNKLNNDINNIKQKANEWYNNIEGFIHH